MGAGELSLIRCPRLLEAESSEPLKCRFSWRLSSSDYADPKPDTFSLFFFRGFCAVLVMAGRCRGLHKKSDLN